MNEPNINMVNNKEEKMSILGYIKELAGYIPRDMAKQLNKRIKMLKEMEAPKYLLLHLLQLIYALYVFRMDLGKRYMFDFLFVCFLLISIKEREELYYTKSGTDRKVLKNDKYEKSPLWSPMDNFIGVRTCLNSKEVFIFSSILYILYRFGKITLTMEEIDTTRFGFVILIIFLLRLYNNRNGTHVNLLSYFTMLYFMQLYFGCERKYYIYIVYFIGKVMEYLIENPINGIKHEYLRSDGSLVSLTLNQGIFKVFQLLKERKINIIQKILILFIPTTLVIFFCFSTILTVLLDNSDELIFFTIASSVFFRKQIIKKSAAYIFCIVISVITLVHGSSTKTLIFFNDIIYRNSFCIFFIFLLSQKEIRFKWAIGIIVSIINILLYVLKHSNIGYEAWIFDDIPNLKTEADMFTV